jgi:hypothetical protein
MVYYKQGEKMKLKATIISIFLAAVLLSAIRMANASPTVLYLDPPNVVGPPPDIGENFTLTLKIDSVSDLYLWVANISWDPNVLQIVENPREGGCLKYGGNTFFTWAEIKPGGIRELTCTLLGAPSGVNVPPAPDDLASLKFRVLNYSFESPIEITFSDLLNSTGDSIFLDAVRGSRFTLLPDYIYSSDNAGVEKNYFVLGDQVYATVPAIGESVTFYVLTNRSWTLGDSFEDYKVYKAIDVPVGSGAVWSTVLVWNVPSDSTLVGAYDLAMDRNNNGIYDNGDLIDDVSVAPGFFVIADLPLGTLTGLAASMLAFLAFKCRKTRK